MAARITPWPRTPTPSASLDHHHCRRHQWLGVDGISVHADLFSIGGHSLVAIRIAARLSEEMQVDLPAAALFNAPTIATLAEQVAVLQAARLELILVEVEGLSDDEAKANL